MPPAKTQHGQQRLLKVIILSLLLHVFALILLLLFGWQPGRKVPTLRPQTKQQEASVLFVPAAAFKDQQTTRQQLAQHASASPPPSPPAQATPPTAQQQNQAQSPPDVARAPLPPESRRLKSAMLTTAATQKAQKIQPPPVRPTQMPTTRHEAPAKHPPTLQDMGKGFLQAMRTATHNQLVRTTPATSARERVAGFKYDSYLQKLFQHFAQTFNSSAAQLVMNESLSSHIVLAIEISRSGAIEAIRIQRSSGNRRVDDYIVGVLSENCTCPPLPTHFQRDTFRLTMPAQVSCMRGFNQLKLSVG